MLCKLFERVVAGQIWDYLSTNELLPVTQSGFRLGHSSETDIRRVLSDILAAVDRGDFAALMSLTSCGRSMHVTDALVSLHPLQGGGLGLSVNGQPPTYLLGFVRLSQAGHPGLRSASSERVMVPRTRSSIGNRAFPVSGTEVWNNLPPHVTSAPTSASSVRA
jgi:hypothetical protein